MSSKDNITTNLAPPSVGLYPHAKRVGEFLFLSGVGPRDPSNPKKIPGVELNVNGEIESYDFATQFHQMMKNVKNILTESGSSFEKLVDVTIFLTNMKKDFPIYNQLYAEYFSTHPSPPTRTTIEVGALPTPIAVEIKGIATL